MREETRCHHMGYPFRLTARVLLYAQSHRIAHTTAFVTPVVEHWLEREIAQWVHPMKDRSDDPSHHERTLLPQVREETCCCHMGYSFRLTARVPLYASSHRQDSTYHCLCNTGWNEKYSKQVSIIHFMPQI